MADEKETSFTTIVSVIGAILISLGFAWLIAQNWHQIPAPLKVFIMVALTLVAYISGVLLREYKYPKVAKSLFVIGALLYTLSIFLIAQIFATPSGAQGIAWLLLIAWLGVIFAAYLLESYTSLIISLIEFLLWLGFQMAAFSERTRLFAYLLFAFAFLIAGVFFYGLGLWHRTYKHPFSKLFQFWTAFYFLAFVYVLSFQGVIPMIWEGTFSSNGVLFLLFFGIVSIVTLGSGIFIAYDKKLIEMKEIGIVLVVIFVLFGLIFLTNLSSGLMGYCSSKTCWNFNTVNLCNNAPEKLNCVWTTTHQAMGNCIHQECSEVYEKATCESLYAKLGCKWQNGTYSQWINGTYQTVQGLCIRTECYLLKDSLSCNSPSPALKCVWQNNACNAEYKVYMDSCQQYENKKQKCQENSECNWQPSAYYYGGGRNIPGILWFVWVVINIFFILFILAIIGYGLLEKSTAIINLGIIFFILDILTRYIGFIADFWGYTSLAVLFIIGGVILIFGGLLIERWRRKLISKAITPSK